MSILFRPIIQLRDISYEYIQALNSVKSLPTSRRAHLYNLIGVDTARDFNARVALRCASQNNDFTTTPKSRP